MHYWYVSLDPCNNSRKAEALRENLEEMVEAYHLNIPGLKPQDIFLYQLALVVKTENLKSNDEWRIQKALELGDAKLLRHSWNGRNFNVRWKKGNVTLNSVVDKNLSVISAGRCLSGTDRQHDLTSLASLMPGERPFDEHGYY